MIQRENGSYLGNISFGIGVYTKENWGFSRVLGCFRTFCVLWMCPGRARRESEPIPVNLTSC